MITKNTDDFSQLDFTSGEVILIDKPLNWSSFKVVYNVKKASSSKKVGHAGTLDPMATGLLILCTGKKTKDIHLYQNLPKTYTGIITLGKKSPSMDKETEITDVKIPKEISEEKICSVRDNFIGEIEQVPPMFSAIKVKGKRLYHHARKNKVIERTPRLIKVEEFEIIKIDIPDIHFRIKCSKGTYIRAIANDFGEKLGSGAILSELRRTEIGNFWVKDALSVDEFKTKIGAAQNLS
ncbi:MAG TPA: tRNA pseudouridine(55) synthase TruB [Ignavibacteriaceae bacterium]|jgi:tRNA pseudouridine55 synthase